MLIIRSDVNKKIWTNWYRQCKRFTIWYVSEGETGRVNLVPWRLFTGRFTKTNQQSFIFGIVTRIFAKISRNQWLSSAIYLLFTYYLLYLLAVNTNRLSPNISSRCFPPRMYQYRWVQCVNTKLNLKIKIFFTNSIFRCFGT